MSESIILALTGSGLATLLAMRLGFSNAGGLDHEDANLRFCVDVLWDVYCPCDL
jgi:hypothetical protein